LQEKFDYDVVIVGAGPAGAVLAQKVAKENHDVALLDMKPREKIGDKVCGDGISASYFDRIEIPHPTGDELAMVMEASDVMSPDCEGVLKVYGKGYTINRLPFGQRLVSDAIKAGAHLMDKSQATGPIIRDNSIVGVTYIDKRTHEKKKITGRVIVDASGIIAVIRNKVPENILLENKVDRFDIAAAYRRIVSFDEAIKWTVKSVLIYLNQWYAPGGYVWIFPKGEKVANIGLGVQPIKGAPNPAALLKLFEKDWEIKPKEIIHEGGWNVPVRRPLAQIAANGLVLVGDAASQANPMHGGGIGHAMLAAYMASKTINKALESEDGTITLEELWGYPVEYMRSNGAKTAALEPIKLLLQGLSNDEINFIIKSKLITGEQLLDIESNPKRGVGVIKKVSLLVKNLRRIKLMNRLRIAANYYYGIYNLFKSYPENPKELAEWNRKVMGIIQESKEKLWRNPLQWAAKI